MRPLKLFDRLPAIHKIEDGKLGGPLEAYLEPVERALNAVKDSIDALYHDLFIDTCAPTLPIRSSFAARRARSARSSD